MFLRSYYTPNDPDVMGQSDSHSINNAIRAARESGCNVVVIPRANERTGSYEWIIDESILLPDEITVILDGCRMIQATGCYCNMFRTATAFDEGARTLANSSTAFACWAETARYWTAASTTAIPNGRIRTAR